MKALPQVHIINADCITYKFNDYVKLVNRETNLKLPKGFDTFDSHFDWEGHYYTVKTQNAISTKPKTNSWGSFFLN